MVPDAPTDDAQLDELVALLPEGGEEPKPKALPRLPFKRGVKSSASIDRAKFDQQTEELDQLFPAPDTGIIEKIGVGAAGAVAELAKAPELVGHLAVRLGISKETIKRHFPDLVEAAKGMTAFGEDLEAWAAGVEDPRFAAQDIKSQLARGAGSMLPFVATGGIGSAAGLGARGGAALIAMTGAAQTAVPMYEDVLAETGNEDKAWAAAALGFGLGATEALGVGKVFAKLNRASAGTFRKALTRVAVESSEEAIQEWVQTFGQSVGTKALSGKEIAYLQEIAQANQGAAVGAILGGMVNTAQQTIASGVEAAREGMDEPGLQLLGKEGREGADFLGPEGERPTLEQRTADGGAEMLGPDEVGYGEALGPEEEGPPGLRGPEDVEAAPPAKEAPAAEEELPPEIEREFPITTERDPVDEAALRILSGEKLTLEELRETPGAIKRAAELRHAPEPPPSLLSTERIYPGDAAAMKEGREAKKLGLPESQNPYAKAASGNDEVSDRYREISAAWKSGYAGEPEPTAAQKEKVARLQEKPEPTPAPKAEVESGMETTAKANKEKPEYRELPDVPRESVAGRSATRLTLSEGEIGSAAKTAQAYDEPVDIMLTKDVPEGRGGGGRAGGKFFARRRSSDYHPSPGHPFVHAATVHPSGKVELELEGVYRPAPKPQEPRTPEPTAEMQVSWDRAAVIRANEERYGVAPPSVPQELTAEEAASPAGQILAGITDLQDEARRPGARRSGVVMDAGSPVGRATLEMESAGLRAFIAATKAGDPLAAAHEKAKTAAKEVAAYHNARASKLQQVSETAADSKLLRAVHATRDALKLTPAPQQGTAPPAEAKAPVTPKAVVEPPRTAVGAGVALPVTEAPPPAKGLQSAEAKAKRAARKKKELPEPPTMTAGQINKELDALEAEDSKLTDAFIAAGRGAERPTDRANKTDPLSIRAREISDRLDALRSEGKARYGPGLTGHLPAKGFGPRATPEGMRQLREDRDARLKSQAEAAAPPAEVAPVAAPKRSKATAKRIASLREHFTPGQLVPAYGNTVDRVVSFSETGGLGGDFNVTVQEVKKDASGKWQPVGPERTHATEPGKRDLAKAEQLNAEERAGEEPTELMAFPGSIMPDVKAALDAVARKLGYIRNQKLTQNGQIPTETWTENKIRKVQDSWIGVKAAQQSIAGAAPADAIDAYLQEELRRSRSKDRLNKFDKQNWEPLLTGLRKGGISPEEFGEALMARHAPERNAVIRTRDADNDAGSGMTDAEAAAIMARIRGGKRAAAFNQAFARFDNAMRETRAGWVRDGLKSQEDVDALEKQYQFYAPLRSDLSEDVEGSPYQGTGRGVDVRGQEFRAATGRHTRANANEVLAYALTQVEQGIIRGEKNRVAQSFLNFLRAYGSEKGLDGFAKISPKQTKRALVDGTVKTVYDPSFQRRDNVLLVHENGDHFWIEIDPKYQNVADAFKNLGAESMNSLLRLAGGFTRRLAGLSTRYNPPFPIFNALRDAAALFIQSQEHGMAFAARSFRDITPAFLGLLGRGTAKWNAYAKEYQASGAPISFLDLDNLSEKLKRIEKATKARGQVGTIGQLRRGWLEFKEALNGAAEVGENMVRFSAYVHAREDLGMSQDRAASWAKNITVNFERRGDWGATANALYMFANAGVQSTARVGQALRHPGVRRLLAAATLGLMGWDQLQRALGGKDDDGEDNWDKIPDYEKRHNFIFMYPDGSGKRVTLPTPFVYDLFQTIAFQLSGAMSGDVKPGAAVGEVLSAAVEAFDPIGGGALDITDPVSIGRFALPTVADPIFEIATNRDWKGDKISKDDYGGTAPDSQRFWPDKTSHVSEAVTTWLNKVAGGDEFAPGSGAIGKLLDISPATLDHIAGFLTGGLGRTLAQANRWTPLGAALGEEPTFPRDVPIVNRMLREPSVYASSTEFHELRDALEVEKDRAVRDRKLLPGALGSVWKEGSYMEKMRKARDKEIDKLKGDARRAAEAVLDTELQRWNARARKALLTTP